MNAVFIGALLSLAVLVSGSAWDDGQWKGEGLAESQDWGQWDKGYGGWDGAHGGWWGKGAWGPGYAQGWTHGAAPLGHDGRVVDTPEVAHAKAAHFAAVAAAGAHGAWAPAHGAWAPAYGAWAPAHGAWAHGAAPLGPDGRVVDTPEVAHAKAAHLAAKSAAGGHAW